MEMRDERVCMERNERSKEDQRQEVDEGGNNGDRMMMKGS